MCGFTRGLKPRPVPKSFVSIGAGATFTCGGVINKAPFHPLVDDFLGKLEIGKRYGITIESEIELRWWSGAPRQRFSAF
jgi:hypothetical protein